MDDLQLIEQLVLAAATRLDKPVSCKIRLFPDINKTIQYARMLQAAGCSLLAVHGRLRECKVGAAAARAKQCLFMRTACGGRSVAAGV
jgi:tRNA-dihydrouridine synthase 1